MFVFTPLLTFTLTNTLNHQPFMHFAHSQARPYEGEASCGYVLVISCRISAIGNCPCENKILGMWFSDRCGGIFSEGLWNWYFSSTLYTGRMYTLFNSSREIYFWYMLLFQNTHSISKTIKSLWDLYLAENI